MDCPPPSAMRCRSLTTTALRNPNWNPPALPAWHDEFGSRCLVRGEALPAFRPASYPLPARERAGPELRDRTCSGAQRSGRCTAHAQRRHPSRRRIAALLPTASLISTHSGQPEIRPNGRSVDGVFRGKNDSEQNRVAVRARMRVERSTASKFGRSSGVGLAML